MTVSYRDSGVDLDLADEVTAGISRRLSGTLFGGFVSVAGLKRYDDPVLVSSIDGIGTKVRLAARLGRVDGLGRDIVHHCVNDIAVHGAEPLFFLDYLALHRLDRDLVSRLIAAIADACRDLDIQLAGGETAEMPLVYAEGHFDIAGAVVGAVERRAIVDGTGIREGDSVIGLSSSGAHTNGYSLIQRLFSDADLRHFEGGLGRTLGDALLEPHRCYLSDIRALLATDKVHGLAHITGGGIPGNLSRIVPDGLRAVVHLPPAGSLFEMIAAQGVESAEMVRVFNLGIGLIAVCDPSLEPPAGTHRLGHIERATGAHEGKVSVDDGG